MKVVTPSVRLTAFSCPHCRALAHQHWFDAFVKRVTAEEKLPICWTEEKVDDANLDSIDDLERRDEIRDRLKKIASGAIEILHKSESQYADRLQNVFVSRCFNCEQVSLWHHTELIYPTFGDAPEANFDTPEHIKRDYQEASSILNLSPRGAAALLRLAIQKLCIELGKPGKNINKDIAALVADGLDVRVQKALDVLRVIGNEAVHPGQIDLKDDRETAEALFKLFNVIVDKLISEPKQIDEIYGSLPPEKLKGIEDRDK